MNSISFTRADKSLRGKTFLQRPFSIRSPNVSRLLRLTQARLAALQRLDLCTQLLQRFVQNSVTPGAVDDLFCEALRPMALLSARFETLSLQSSQRTIRAQQCHQATRQNKASTTQGAYLGAMRRARRAGGRLQIARVRRFAHCKLRARAFKA